MENLEEQSDDLILGCVIGAYTGDAAGAVLEFMHKIGTERVENALKFNGGGEMRVGKGQITDDSEMAQCLVHALLKGGSMLNLDEITAYFGHWCNETNPFDMGFTTEIALGGIDFEKPCPSKVI